MKLSARFNDTTVLHRIQGILQKFTSSMEVEIQQRAVEYSNLFSYDNIRPAVLERMPVPEERLMSESTGGRGTPCKFCCVGFASWLCGVILTSSYVPLALDGGHSSKAGPSDQDVSGLKCTGACPSYSKSCCLSFYVLFLSAPAGFDGCRYCVWRSNTSYARGFTHITLHDFQSTSDRQQHGSIG
jgi:hypothetical protein